jgi:SAM-dependent methyltransferase
MQPVMTSAAETYAGLAPFYDELTREHDYEGWTYHLEQVALRFGVSGRRLLDAACGTGKSFLPFLERGYEVTACDISPAMAAIAERKAAGRARVELHDMRTLPRLGEFDLVCCLDDAVNHLLDEADLVAALRAMRANLAHDGVLVFDANTLMAYRGFFATATVIRAPGRVLVCDGRTPSDMPVGGAAEIELLAFEDTGDGCWARMSSPQRQRHFDEATVRAALAAAGLPWVATYGMHLDGSVTDGFDEIDNSKAVYVARASAPDDGERR